MEKELKELKALVEAMKGDIDTFRELQKERFEQVEKTGAANEETQTKLDELAKKLDATETERGELKARIDTIETDRKRHALGGKEEPEEGKPFKSFGDQIVAVMKSADPSKGTDPRLLEVKAAGLSENIGADGGFLVQTDFANELIKRTYETGAVSSRVRKIPISSGANGLKIPGVNETSRVDGSRYGGITAYWQCEAAEKTASQPEYRIIELSLNKLTGLCYATDELLQDAAALEAFLMMAFPEEMNFKLEDAILTGTGAGMPLGILNSGAVVTVAKEVGQAATTLVAENIIKMWARMWARSRQNSVWLINQDIEPQLMQMYIAVGASGIPVYMPAGGLSGKPYGTLMGRPVIPVEYCPTLGTVGDIMLVDLSQYLVIEKGGVQSARSIHVRFIYDETAFRFVYRADGQPLWNAALTPHSGSANTLSPFVVCATRA